LLLLGFFAEQSESAPNCFSFPPLFWGESLGSDADSSLGRLFVANPLSPWFVFSLFLFPLLPTPRTPTFGLDQFQRHLVSSDQVNQMLAERHVESCSGIQVPSLLPRLRVGP